LTVVETARVFRFFFFSFSFSPTGSGSPPTPRPLRGGCRSESLLCPQCSPFGQMGPKLLRTGRRAVPQYRIRVWSRYCVVGG
jgi:hypothetical protein